MLFQVLLYSKATFEYLKYFLHLQLVQSET